MDDALCNYAGARAQLQAVEDFELRQLLREKPARGSGAPQSPRWTKEYKGQRQKEYGRLMLEEMVAKHKVPKRVDGRHLFLLQQ